MDCRLLATSLLFSIVCVDAANVSPRIAGGIEITDNNRRNNNYIALVVNSNGTYTGVVLHESFILVPAHIFDGTVMGNSTVVFIPPSTGVGIITYKLHKHPDYKPSTFENDIALIEMNNALVLNENFSKIEVGSSSPAVKTPCKVLGFGKTSPDSTSIGIAHFLNVVIKAANTCSAIKGQTCAGADDPDTDTSKTLCNSDVGAPLVCDGKVVAIAIKDDKCKTTNSDLFLELADLRKWIYTKVPNSAVPVVLNPLALLSTLAVIFKIRY